MPFFLPYSWLFDLLSYVIDSLAGGASLVLVKSLLIALTTRLIVGPHHNWRQLFGAFLAVLALGAWLPLHPIILSYVFIAITISHLLTTPKVMPSDGWRALLAREWSFVAMFIFWANCDPFCLLGLTIVGLHTLARTLSDSKSSRSSSSEHWRLLGLLILAVAISPLPWQPDRLVEFVSLATNADPTASPFRAGLFTALSQGRIEGTVPVVSFWLLIVVGLWSFIAAPRARFLERFLPFTSLFILTLFDFHFVPFFVIVSSAILVRNLGQIKKHVTKPEAEIHWTAPIKAVVAGFGSLVVLLAAWAGWLQQIPAERRNWTTEPDTSLVRAAIEVERWYSSDILTPQQHLVVCSRDAEELFVWFAPSCLTDHWLVNRGASGIERVHSAITPSEGAPRDDLLTDPGITVIVLSDANRLRFSASLSYLTMNPKQWRMVYLRGRVAIFVRVGAVSALPTIDLPLRCFDPSAPDRAPETDRAAFAPAHWSDPFLVPRAPRSIDRDEAITYLLHEEATRDVRSVSAANHFLATLAASIVGAPPRFATAWPIDQRVAMLCTAAGAVRPPSEGPAPLPFNSFSAFLILSDVTADHYLAVRSARRAVAAAPHDPGAYTVLGEAYLHLLLSDQLEKSWSTIFPVIRRLRQVQAAAAFRQALAFDPSTASAHDGLARIYLDLQFLDLAEQELRAYVRLTGGQAPLLDELSAKVAANRKSFLANSVNLLDLDRARLAMRGNLAGEALEILLKSDVSIFDSPGLTLEMDLLLAVGRAGDAREWLTPDHRKDLGDVAFAWYHAQAAAALGDYTNATGMLGEQINAAILPPPTAEEFRTLLFLVGKGFLNKQTFNRMMGNLGTSIFGGLALYGRQAANQYQRRTETYLLLALLSMEQGDISATREYLARIQLLWEQVESDQFRYPSPARVIADQMRSLLRR